MATTCGDSGNPSAALRKGPMAGLWVKGLEASTGDGERDPKLPRIAGIAVASTLHTSSGASMVTSAPASVAVATAAADRPPRYPTPRLDSYGSPGCDAPRLCPIRVVLGLC